MSFSFRNLFQRGADPYRDPEHQLAWHIGQGTRPSRVVRPNASFHATMQVPQVSSAAPSPFQIGGTPLFKTAGNESVAAPPINATSGLSPFSLPSAAPTNMPLIVGDVVGQLPPEIVRGGVLHSEQPISLPPALIENALRSGQASVPIFEIYRVCPALFQTPVSPQDPRMVPLPAAKLPSLIASARNSGQPPASPFSSASPNNNPFEVAKPAAENPPPDLAATRTLASPFAAQPQVPASAPSAFPVSPFATSVSTAAAAPAESPFAASAPSPFAVPAASPFATSAASPAPSPFATAAAPAASPFAAAASPFSAPTTQAPAASPFAAQAPAASPFAAQAPAPSPFAAQAPAPSPFAAQAPAPSPFSAQAPTASLFPASLGSANPFAPATESAPPPNPFAQAAAPAPIPAPAPPVQALSQPPQAQPAPAAPAAPAAPQASSGKAKLSLGASLAGYSLEELGFNPVSVPAWLQSSVEISTLQDQVHNGVVMVSLGTLIDGVNDIGFRNMLTGAKRDFQVKLPQNEVFHALTTSQAAPAQPPALTPAPSPQPAPVPAPMTIAAAAPMVIQPAATATQAFAPFTQPTAAPAPSPAFSFTPPAAAQPAPAFSPFAQPAAAPVQATAQAAAPSFSAFSQPAAAPTPAPAFSFTPPAIEQPAPAPTFSAFTQPAAAPAAGPANAPPASTGMASLFTPPSAEPNAFFAAAAPTVPAAPPPPPASPATSAFFSPPPEAAKTDTAGLVQSIPSIFSAFSPTPPASAPAPFTVPAAPQPAKSFDPFAAPTPSAAPAENTGLSSSQLLGQASVNPFPPAPQLSSPLLSSEAKKALIDPFAAAKLNSPPVTRPAPEPAPAPFLSDSAPSAFFAPAPELPTLPAIPAAKPVSAPSPAPAAASAPLKPQSTHAAPNTAGRHSFLGLDPVDTQTDQLLLRALLGTEDSLDASRVVQLLATQPGLCACVCLSGSSVLSHADTSIPDAATFQQQAADIARQVRSLAPLIGISDAETFTLNAGGRLLTFCFPGDLTLGVLHDCEPTTGLRDKITLIARELSRMLS